MEGDSVFRAAQVISSQALVPAPSNSYLRQLYQTNIRYFLNVNLLYRLNCLTLTVLGLPQLFLNKTVSFILQLQCILQICYSGLIYTWINKTIIWFDFVISRIPPIPPQFGVAELIL
jgi:hypothetical protein